MSTGCSAAGFPVTVTPFPKAISGPITVCVGQTITLSDTVGGGTWTSLNLPVATVGSLSGVVTGVSAGTATIVYSLGTGCDVQIDITVLDLAPIMGPNVCVQQIQYY